MEENGTYVLRDDPEYSDINSEERKNTYKDTLKNAFSLHCNIDFDDGLMILYGALRFHEENYYNDLPEINNKLLFFEFKSAGAMVQIFPLILIIFVFIFFAWLFARFVIDNAFEISSQERSAQYVALRIMGDLKIQLVTLIFTKSLFYTITACLLYTSPSPRDA